MVEVVGAALGIVLLAVAGNAGGAWLSAKVTARAAKSLAQKREQLGPVPPSGTPGLGSKLLERMTLADEISQASRNYHGALGSWRGCRRFLHEVNRLFGPPVLSGLFTALALNPTHSRLPGGSHAEVDLWVSLYPQSAIDDERTRFMWFILIVLVSCGTIATRYVHYLEGELPAGKSPMTDVWIAVTIGGAGLAGAAALVAWFALSAPLLSLAYLGCWLLVMLLLETKHPPTLEGTPNAS